MNAPHHDPILAELRRRRFLAALGAGLLAAARFERDYRFDSYSRRIAASELTAEQMEAACIDFQCWTAIAEWIETDRFVSFHGGADPERQAGMVGKDGRLATEDAPLIRWPELEDAAKKALDRVAAKLDALEDKPNVEPETLGELRARRSCLFAIHRKVALRRESIDAINAEFRAARAITQGEDIAA